VIGKRLQQDRFHLIVHLLLLLILVGQLYSFSPGKNNGSTEQIIVSEFTGQIILGQESAELTDEEIKKGIQIIVDEIHAKDGDLFRGIHHILISREDIGFFGNGSCNGHVLGAFSDGKILVRESGEETNRRTLYHEIGHNVWKRLPDGKKEEWRSLFLSSEHFVTAYASTGAEEDFAESLSCMMTEKDGCASLDGKKREFIEKELS